MQDKVEGIEAIRSQFLTFSHHVGKAIKAQIKTKAIGLEKWTETEVDKKLEELKSLKIAAAHFLDLPIV